MVRFIIFLSLVFSLVPAYADDQLNEQCKNLCKSAGHDYTEGYFNDSGAQCKDGYTVHESDPSCCCK